MQKGSLALLLHAHLPWVRHPSHEEFLEEDWLHEAVVECYLPLLRVFRNLVAGRVPVRITLTMTPPLCAMLRDPLLQSRTRRYLDRGLAFIEAERLRTGNHGAMREILDHYDSRLREARALYLSIGGDVVGAFAQLQADGLLQIITCAATHGFLPLMESVPGAMRAQILLGCDFHRECFGSAPEGIWLPECGYVPGVDRYLQEADIRWFVADAHGLLYGEPRPRFGTHAAYFTPAGPAVFGRDRESSRKVWSAREGYPGDPAYRDFHKDAGFDLPEDYLRKYFPGIPPRRHTGFKYHRVTGRPEKEFYHRAWAMAAADHHAGDYFDGRVAQFRNLAAILPVEPIVLSPFDAELFGHWWYEGPEFLDLFLRKAAHDQNLFRLETPGDYLRRNPTQQLVSPSPSSWGNKGYWEVWLDPCNSWIYPHLHAAARQMTAAARARRDDPRPLTGRFLRQMARELLLAQSSDWAFLMKTGTAREYATCRTKDHILRFNALSAELDLEDPDVDFLAECEAHDNIFPNLDWTRYL
jgi:1,4-alpha-glucan branching enzyme